MKKYLFVLTMVCCFLLLGCNNLMNEEKTKSGNYKSDIALRIESFRNDGLLDGLIQNSRSADDEESKIIYDFIYNTDEVLNKILEEENGQEKVYMLNSLFCGGSIEDFIMAYEKVDIEKATELEAYLKENFDYKITDGERSCLGAEKLKFSFYSKDLAVQRAAYAKDMEWSTIAWYTGFCAATVAGAYLASFGGIFARAAGYVALAAGAFSMGVQLTEWCTSTDLISFVMALKNLDINTLKTFNEKGMTGKMVTICTETVATLLLIYILPKVKTAVSLLIEKYNTFIGKLIDALPSGIEIVINGIPIRKIDKNTVSIVYDYETIKVTYFAIDL